jgi:hypothetical protein
MVRKGKAMLVTLKDKHSLMTNFQSLRSPRYSRAGIAEMEMIREN